MNLKTLLRCVLCATFLFVGGNLYSQNLLDTSSWTIGSGSVGGFFRNGEISENVREFGTDPFDNSSILWKGGNDSASNADGGWNSSYYAVDHTETYRFTVWLKKTNSTNGHSYVGFNANNSGSLKLDDTFNGNPYFWVGDLPQLNKWYLVVGYVHGSNYNSNLSYGGIYDPDTGTKVVNITDYKFANTATHARHRAYLYYDTNTSDRQYFYAPRMEMVDGNEPPIADLLGLNDVDETNLLDDSTWTVGCGSISGFDQYGVTSENCRELGRNHINKEVLLWKASPNNGGNGSGGFTSPAADIDHTKMYQMSVWIKKTGSNDGTTHFKPNSYSSGSDQTTYLNGTIITWHPFWYGDLPKFNRWYLLVGYVHGSNDNSTIDLGKIYDGVTGDVVLSMRDHKFKNTATILKNQAILWASTTTSDRQYMYAPRIEVVNGNESTLEQLLSINPDSKLLLSYDISGNQNQRFYCEEDGFCSPVAPQSRMINEEGVKMQEEGVVVAEQTDVPLPGEEIKEETDLLDVKHSIYPNPTDGRVTIQLSGKDYNLTNSINIYNVNGSLVKRININNPTNQIELDISNMPLGTYLIHMHFTNGTVKTEQIIKN